ncbi:hypothetical protein Tco_1372671 [Tanacetum coccineum]
MISGTATILLFNIKSKSLKFRGKCFRFFQEKVTILNGDRKCGEKSLISSESILGGTKSFLISSRMKSPLSNGVKKGEDLAMIGLEIRVGLPLSELPENPNTS